MITIESHPFEPFLPENARILFLGSFPPQSHRWCMEFYYPNWINDFWRITSEVFFGERAYFIIPGEKRFNVIKIKDFCSREGIALYDTATKVRRLRENASDEFLEIVEPTDIKALLEKIPHCGTIVTTGGKATETLCTLFGCEPPKVGSKATVFFSGKELSFWRMPSTSRAYPLPLEKKTASYRRLFIESGFALPGGKTMF